MAIEIIAAVGSALPVPGDIRRTAVHRFEKRRPGSRRVEIGRGGPAYTSGHGPGQVCEDVAEEVVRDDDVVALGDPTMYMQAASTWL